MKRRPAEVLSELFRKGLIRKWFRSQLSNHSGYAVELLDGDTRFVHEKLVSSFARQLESQKNK